MKVLQILPELNSGGVERGTLEVAGHLVANGHEALVVSNGGRLVAALEASGARHITMPVHRKRPGAIAQIARLRNLLVSERPDILHIRSRLPGWIAWLAWKSLPQATRPRLVSTVHGFYSVNAYSAVMTHGERVIAVSESVRSYITSNYPDTKSITVIHRGVDPCLYHPDFKPSDGWLEAWQRENPQLNGKIVLTLPGRLTRWKGQLDFLNLLSELVKSGQSVHGLLVGEAHPKKADFEHELRTTAQNLGLQDHVTFLGHRQDVKEVMAVSDLVFSLSRDPEAFGRVSLEAMALGRPVIAYNHGGVGEQLNLMFPEGLVPKGDIPAVHQKVREILTKKSLPGPLPPELGLKHMLGKTLSVYRDLLTDPRQ